MYAPAVSHTFCLPPHLLFPALQGAKKYISSQNPSWTDDQSAWVSAVCAGGAGLIAAVAILPLLRWMHARNFSE